MSHIQSILLSARTHVGTVRENNEDAVGWTGWMTSDSPEQANRQQLTVDESHPIVAMVADGMGGHRAGEVASGLAIKELVSSQWPSRDDSRIKQALHDSILAAHVDIDRKSTDQPQYFGMGTTLAGVLVTPASVYFYNVGDSRVYLYRDGDLSQVSTDDCPEYGRPNVLTQALGGNRMPVPHIGVFDCMAGDRILLCSDGLTDMVDDAGIAHCLRELDAGADRLVEKALASGGRDNITVVVVDLI